MASEGSSPEYKYKEEVYVWHTSIHVTFSMYLLYLRLESVSKEANQFRCQLDLLKIDKEQLNSTILSLKTTIEDLQQQIKNLKEVSYVYYFSCGMIHFE